MAFSSVSGRGYFPRSEDKCLTRDFCYGDKRDLLKKRPWRVDLTHNPIELRDFKIQTITKIEKSGFIDLDWPRKDARAVNNCTPRANAATGPYYWAFSLAMKSTLGASEDDQTIMWTPGQSSEHVGQFFDKWTEHFSQLGRKVMYVYGDQSAFDAHQNRGTHNFERKLFQRCGLQDVLHAHSMGGVPRGSHQKYDIKFNAGKQARVSGQGITSAGNVAISIAANIRALGLSSSATWAGIFNGDDYLVISTEAYLSNVMKDYDTRMAELGLAVEHVVSSAVSDLEFCQTVPYPTEDGTIFAPKIGRLMSRIGVSCSFADPTMKSIASGLFVTCHHVPFIHDLLVKYLELTSTHADTYVKDYKFHPQLNNFAAKPHLTSGATWDFLYQRYGLTPIHLDEFKKVLDTITELPAVIEWPMINSLVARDE